MSTPTIPASETSPTASDGFLAQARSSRWLPIAVLCGVTFAFYHRLWLPGLVLIKRDASWLYLPLKQYMLERLTAGELPQWFPYEALGRPFIGVAATGVFHPFTALYFVFSVPDAYRASTLFSCLLAALGAFVLGCMLNFSRTGALLAGIAFTFSGYVVSFTESLVYLYAICMLPFFCAALEKALVSGAAWTVAPALVWASVLLNGDFQTGYYYGLIALLWTVARSPLPRLKATLRLTLVVCLTALLAGIQLGPTWAVFVNSERVHPNLFHEQALLWSTHPLRLVTMLAAPVGQEADPSTLARFFFGTPAGSLWAESLYLGVPVTGLALLGTWCRRDLRALALLGGLAFLLSLGRYGGLYEVFYHVVPFWSAFRFPEKLMGVASFAVAMLAGAGLDALRAGKGRATPWLVTAAVGLLAGLVLHTESANAWLSESFGAPTALVHEVTSSAALAFLFSTVTALGVGIVTAGIQRGALRLEVLLAVLVTIVTLDLARANAGAYHTAPVEAATFTPPLLEALRAREGTLAPGRFRMVTIERFTFATPVYLKPLLGQYGAQSVEHRQALDLEHNAQFRLETVRPYLPGYSTVFAAMSKATIEQQVGMEAAARLNATYYVGRRHHLKNPQLAREVIAELPGYDLALFRNPVPAKPRAYLSLQPERASAPVDPATLLARPDFLNGTVDVIETIAESLPGPARGGHATIEQYKPEEVRVRVETPQPAVLILLDAFDQGWTATLEDGVEVPIRRANALVRAVVVPAGAHMITFRYETPLLYAGAAASLFGVLLSLSLIVHARWRACQEDPVP
jgi:hypothetical protein